MYFTIPIHWNIKSAPASLGRSRVGPAFYVFSFLGTAPLVQTSTVARKILNFSNGIRSTYYPNNIGRLMRTVLWYYYFMLSSNGWLYVHPAPSARTLLLRTAKGCWRCSSSEASRIHCWWRGHRQQHSLRRDVAAWRLVLQVGALLVATQRVCDSVAG
jgi:hypothetical protein